MEKVVLAYSGGLDTSCCLAWLKDCGFAVISYTADLGQGINFAQLKKKAKNCGASKVYIQDVRNRFLKPYDYYQYNKLQEIGIKVFSHIKLKSFYFSVLLIDISHEETFDVYQHKQSADMGVLWKDMDTRYEHNDKPLTLINYDIKPNQIKKVIGTGESIVKRNNKIDVFLKT